MCIIQDLRSVEVSRVATLHEGSLTAPEVGDLLKKVENATATWDVDEQFDYNGDQTLIFSLQTNDDRAPSVVVHRASEGVVISVLTEDTYQRRVVVPNISAAAPLLRELLIEQAQAWQVA